MDIATKIIAALGAAGSIRGLFSIYSGWVDYSLGNKNENAQQQDKGSAGMTYGAMMVAGSVGIAASIIAALGQFSF